MTAAQTSPPTDRRLVIAVLGFSQILAWGTSFYFPAVFAGPIVRDTGWSLGYVVGGTSVGLLVAGLISPSIGRIIGHRGGRPVLLASSLFYAAGLSGLALAPTLPVFLLAWVVVGIGMGTGLYDAVFAALGRMYGSAARGAITNLTLIGGFSSTICWPLSAFMIEHMGWRYACLAYAALHLLVSLPLQMLVVRKDTGAFVSGDTTSIQATAARIPNETAIFALLALVMSLLAGIGSTVIVHMMIFLQARGVDFATAVSLGTLFGPAQIGARVVERLFGSHYHPIWTMIGSVGLMATGLVLLSTGVNGIVAIVFIILIYGGGYGVSWIGRGTLPLALFGPVRFPQLMGKLAFPSLVVQALAPSAGAILIERIGADQTIGVLTAFALINLVLIGVLWRLCRGQPSGP
jgi:MFS family permease